MDTLNGTIDLGEGAPIGGHAACRHGGFDLSGGHLAFDFANTVEDRPSPRPCDGLLGYGDLVTWGSAAGVLDTAAAERLRRRAAERPDEAAAVFERAVALREAIYRIFGAVASERPPEPDDLAILNAALAAWLGFARVVPRGDGFAWDWAPGDELGRMLWPVARSAADLLTSGETAAVRQCLADDCNWLFMDTSRNGSRRWCNMRVCGNRAKARRHQQRKRAGQM